MSTIESQHEANLVVVCPYCRSSLQMLDRELQCKDCQRSYPRLDGVDVLLDAGELERYNSHFEREYASREVYRYYRRSSSITQAYYGWWVDRMFALVPPDCNGPVLELMAGEGEIIRRLPERFSVAAALDVDLEAVQSAARAVGTAKRTLRLLCSSAERLPFEDGSFDLVMVQGGLHHVRANLEAVLAEVARVLRPGGLLIGSEPANDGWLLRWARRLQYRISPHQGHDEGEDGFTREQLAADLGRAELKLEHYDTFGFLAYALVGNMDLLPLLRPFRQRKVVGRLLLSLDNALEHTELAGWASLFRARRR